MHIAENYVCMHLNNKKIDLIKYLFIKLEVLCCYYNTKIIIKNA